ncbi:hypothetical protein BDL97_04G046000 [Sphagnum fallax]|nr:hypothetical protein BDL97_04G046000 [Sphagnum fallax]KAH8964101.1 hypothetical protein BDL97_04G046000 [Sphagnum fallax]KAH8964102.1 hypothetical protein BDL97_04G046000 [Sphagnum fallax]KAH8964103.1 hypothetical protein BDL97_04G046000 [Sphagnum fallax]KAH8964104.1 hypothetical protein BDL97_04G046000 [Sphagnum fallax]
MMHCHGSERLQSSPGSSCCSAVRFLVGLLLISAAFSWEFAWGKKFTTTKLRQSVCQNLAPSPVLEPFVDKLPRLKAIHIHNRKQLTLGAYKITQKLHRDLPPTPLYAFGTSRDTASYPGPTLEARRGVESYVRFENHIHDRQHMLRVDKTLMWANPQTSSNDNDDSGGGVPIVPHLHGGEVESSSDGYPDAWFTATGGGGVALHGPAYRTQNYTYANSQPATMLWYHDHSLGIVRLNVLSGLFGAYIIREDEDEDTSSSSKAELEKNRSSRTSYSWMLPKEEEELVLLLHDMQFFPDGSINFPTIGDSPKMHPSWCPEYFGDTILVNGKAWPYVRVQPRMYRLRVVNAANARFFQLSLSDERLSFVQIGTDGGLLDRPQVLSELTIAPAERIDFLIDFALLGSGAHEILLLNSGPAPFPSGDPAFSPPRTKNVMKFFVVKDSPRQRQNPEPERARIPAQLRGGETEEDEEASSALVKTVPIESFLQEANWRTNFMVEFDDKDDSPTHSLLSNHSWSDPVTEKPVLGATEVWEFINFTPDAHPMHIHLVQFRFLNQQSFNQSLSQTTMGMGMGMEVGEEGKSCSFHLPFPDPRSCFTEEPRGPAANQVGWKDTIVSWPGNVTRLLLQWTSRDGDGSGSGQFFPFDATAGPGYVWHCHILDHEDNEMMRPIAIQPRP